VVAEVVSENEPEVVAEVVAEVVSENEPEVVAEVVAEVVSENEPEVVAEVVAEVVSENEPEVVTKTKVHPKMKLIDAKQMCYDMGIVAGSKWKKADYIKALQRKLKD
jgi:hypothetical protein